MLDSRGEPLHKGRGEFRELMDRLLKAREAFYTLRYTIAYSSRSDIAADIGDLEDLFDEPFSWGKLPDAS